VKNGSQGTRDESPYACLPRAPFPAEDLTNESSSLTSWRSHYLGSGGRRLPHLEPPRSFRLYAASFGTNPRAVTFKMIARVRRARSETPRDRPPFDAKPSTRSSDVEGPANALPARRSRRSFLACGHAAMEKRGPNLTAP